MKMTLGGKNKNMKFSNTFRFRDLRALLHYVTFNSINFYQSSLLLNNKHIANTLP